MAALTLLCAAGSPRGQDDARIEIHRIETVTLKTQQVLTGDPSGEYTKIAGKLWMLTADADKFPAVVLVHGSGGVHASIERWAEELNSIGVAAFILDSFIARGISSTVNDQSQLDSLAMLVDAYRALAELARHPRIDPSRIAVMGFSKGAIAAVYSSNERFRNMYAAAGMQFVAHIGLYTPCNVTYRDDHKTTGKPIRLFHGTADDWVRIGPCRDYVERLKHAGADARLTEYLGAFHAYDVSYFKELMRLPDAQTARNCTMVEGDDGVVLNGRTGQPFTLDDPCVERGVFVAYDAAAHQATVKAVKEFLLAAFKLE